MKKRKKAAKFKTGCTGILLIFLFLFLLTGCGTEKSEERSSEADQKDRLQIGIEFRFVCDRAMAAGPGSV